MFQVTWRQKQHSEERRVRNNRDVTHGAIFFLEPAEIIDNFNSCNLNAVMKISRGKQRTAVKQQQWPCQARALWSPRSRTVAWSRPRPSTTAAEGCKVLFYESTNLLPWKQNVGFFVPLTIEAVTWFCSFLLGHLRTKGPALLPSTMRSSLRWLLELTGEDFLVCTIIWLIG